MCAVSIPSQCSSEKLLDPCVAEYSVTGRTRRETRRLNLQALFQDSKTQVGSKHQQTGIAQARQRAILRQVWVLDQRTISRGLEKRGSPIS